MSDLEKSYDVVVAGGGNAALCAALTAREAGASVLLLESAPRDFRGGNSRHTRNLRVMHEHPTATLTGSYSAAEYWNDLLQVTEGKTDEALARVLIQATSEVLPWMEAHGARFQPALRGTLSLSRTNAFFLGGGKALLNAYYEAAVHAGIEIAYEAEVRALRLADGIVREIEVAADGSVRVLKPRAVVVSSGGFQANLAWLREYWGDAADNFVIRGTPYAQGLVLKNLLEQGVASVGDPTQFHAIAVDARAPKFDGGIVTRLDCIPFGIVVDRDAKRFADEGQDLWPKRYAAWGRLIAQRPGQIAFAILDAKSKDLFMPSAFPAMVADTLRDLARHLELSEQALEGTVREFNAGVREGSFASDSLDDCHTAGLAPPKSHWARRIETAPFLGYPLRPGITFTYLGVQVDAQARALLANSRPCANLFAAGEIMAGNLLGQGYIAGIGMAIGTVFGRIAGGEAARVARNGNH